MSRRGDLGAVAWLLGAAAVVAWPVLDGGYRTYLDNPAHLAEIHSLASENGNGWSNLAYCGYPLRTLHSPLWYGLLAGIERAGGPADVCYAVLLWLSFAAPALAVYVVARRRIPAVAAVALGYLLLVQRPAVVGFGSPLGGMWTFFLAAAAFVLLLDRLAGTVRSVRNVAGVAILVGFIGLTHLFALAAAMIATCVSASAAFGRPDRWHELRGRTIALGAGLLASAAYWFPLSAAGGLSGFTPQNLRWDQVLFRLAVPTNLMGFWNIEPTFPHKALALEAVPMALLLLGGLAGGIVALGRGSRGRREEGVARLGAAVGLLLLLLLAVVATATNATFLGPVSWRFLYFVRIGLALASISLVAALPTLGQRPRLTIGLAVVGLCLGPLWSGSLRDDVPDRAALSDVEQTWSWLRVHARSDWGRVYVQDSFYTLPDGDPLRKSHVLVLTAFQTGVRQLGPMYAIAPFETVRWTRSEFGRLFDRVVRRPDDVRWVDERMELTNCTHILTCDASLAEQLLSAGRFERRFRHGRFSVLRRRGAVSRWVVAPEGSVHSVSYETGRIGFDLGTESNVRILIKESYHPFWAIGTGAGATPRPHPLGLMEVEAPGGQRIELVYRPPTWPARISILVWLGLLGASVRRGPVCH